MRFEGRRADRTLVASRHQIRACNMYALTVSKASAAFVKRLAAKCSSARRRNSSRSASLANSIATPRFVSGASVGVARKSLQLNPRRPGNVVHPSWYIIDGLSAKGEANRKPPNLSPSRPQSRSHQLRSSIDINPRSTDRFVFPIANFETLETRQ